MAVRKGKREAGRKLVRLMENHKKREESSFA